MGQYGFIDYNKYAIAGYDNDRLPVYPVSKYQKYLETGYTGTLWTFCLVLHKSKTALKII